MAENQSNKVQWDKLEWLTRLQICQQGASAEDGLLHTYITIFVAIEAIISAVGFGVLQLNTAGFIVVSSFGILIAFLWLVVTRKRSEAVDRWDTLLYGLWKEVDSTLCQSIEKKALSGFVKHYEGSHKRYSEEGFGNSLIIFKSGRMWITVFVPILLIVLWVGAIIWKLVDC